MADVNPKIEAFFTEAKNWKEELEALRGILLEGPLTEEFKWRSLCYTYQGGNVATVWGFKEHCALSFFKGVLLKDAAGILVPPGENSRSVRMATFRSVTEIVEKEALLKDYLREAVELEKAGRKVKFEKDDLAYPGELVDRLDRNPDFRAAFEALTPGRRRGYVLHFSQAKQSKTRTSRIDKFMPKILAGKGLHDR